MKTELVAVKKEGIVKTVSNKVKAVGAMAWTAAVLSTTSAIAGPITINPGLTQEGGVGAIISVILSIAQAIGGISLIMGVFMTVQSFMSDNPESRNRGVTLAIVGAVLIGLELLLKTAKIIN